MKMKLRFERWVPVVMVLLAVPLLMAQQVNRSSGGGTTGGATSNYVNSSVATASNSLVAQISAAGVWTNPATGLKLVDQSASVAEWNANLATIFLGFPPFPVLDPAAFSGDIFLWGAQPAQNLTNGFDIIAIGDFPLDDFKSGSDVIALGDVVGGGLVTAKQTILIGNGGSVAGGSGAFTNVIIWGNSSSFPRLMLNVFCAGSSTLSFVGNADQALVSAVLLGSDQSISDASGSYSNIVALGDGVQISGNGQMIFGNGISNYVFGTGCTAGSVSNAVRWNNTGLLSAYNGVATLLHATATNSLITVGSSPFNYTNTAAQTIVVDLDAAGATTAVKRNGTQIYGSLVGGDHEMILKPGAYITVTFSLGTPIMSWTEL